MSIPKTLILPSVPNGFPRSRKLRVVLTIGNGVLSGGQYNYEWKDTSTEESGGRLVDLSFPRGVLPAAAPYAQGTDHIVFENV